MFNSVDAWADGSQLSNNGKLGFKVAAGLAIPMWSTLTNDSWYYDGGAPGLGIGPAFHASIFSKLNKKFELSGGIEFFMFSSRHHTPSNNFELTSSGVYTISILGSGRYILKKYFIEGGINYSLNKITWTDESTSPNSTSIEKYTMSSFGFRTGVGYRISNFLEAEICTYFIGRSAIFLMIGVKK